MPTAFSLVRPCNDCPFRHESIPGWTGNYSPQQVLDTVSGEGIFLCHSLIDYMAEDWKEEAEENGQQCAGWAAYAANTCKIPKDKATADFVRKIGRRNDVFKSPMSFLEHHKGE